MRVLLIEDDTDLLDVMPLLLQELAGWEVACFSAGDQALAATELVAAADLALVDLRMRPLTGPEVVEGLRRLRPTGLVIVMLSGQPPTPAELRGTDGCILKPFTYAELMEQLAPLLAPRPGP